MRVIAPEDAAARRPASRAERTLNIELLGLLIASAVVLVGVVLAHAAQVRRLAEIAPASGVVSLPGLTSPAELEPVLTMYESPVERQAVARALFLRATAGPRLEHVGGLTGVTIPAADVRRDRRFAQLRSRLERRPGAAAVAVLSPADLSAVKPRLAVRTVGEFNARVGRAVAWFLVAFWLAHLFRRWRRRDDDPVLLPAVMLLCGVGVITMLGLRDPVRDTIAATLFAGGATAGVLVLVLASEVDFEAWRLRRSVLVPLGLALVLAVVLLLFGSGPGASNVKVNLLGVQPVEAIRLLVVFALAAYFGRRLELLRELSEPATPTRPWLRYVRVPRWTDVRPVLASMALVLAFFFLQKDLGPALVLSCVFLALYGVGRGHVAFVLTGLAMLVGGFALAYWIGVPETVRHRVAIWSNPWNNGVPGGNHIAQGLWALSTGAAWGSGPGLGSAQTIPAGHTDFVLAAVGEELGFGGLVVVVALYALVCWRCLRVAAHAPGDYTAFLAAGLALALIAQALVIGGGLLGVIPLAGVVTPFLSYGRSSMLANAFAIGAVLAIAKRRSAVREHLKGPIRALGATLAAAGIALTARAGWVQVVRADGFASASALSQQADGGYRFEHNPRLLAAARTLVRGTIYDRNGLPLATSRPEEIGSIEAMYRAAGITTPQPCPPDDRCYPLGGLAFHVVGDWNTQANWAARNSSYVERDSDAQLKGYDDRARVVEVVHPRTGRAELAIQRDFRELLPLVRERYRPASRAVRDLLARDRDVRTSIDARLQLRAAIALRDRIETAGTAHGAAVVLDAASGDVLASVSYPWPSAEDLAAAGHGLWENHPVEVLLDRARYGLYPPGSTFKLLVAAAALRAGADKESYACVRLPGGRVGNYIRGSSRPVRDDPMDRAPHGQVDLRRALIVSCNAYFAQLAQRLGPGPLLDAASVFQIDVARTPTPAGLLPTLPHAGYGQGQVVVSPLKLARLSASIAAAGRQPPVRSVLAESAAARSGSPEPAAGAAGQRFLAPADAARLAQAMRAVMTTGTGRSLAGTAVPIAGKTGTAEVTDAPAHSWFTGFAPFGGGGRRIAFAVIIENAGYGARAAAPVAGEIVAAAHELGLIK
jgi:cell division protein FtsW (lipid II flippase)/cell division protein FtsI/penicillin-binding protein 2